MHFRTSNGVVIALDGLVQEKYETRYHHRYYASGHEYQPTGTTPYYDVHYFFSFY